MTPQQFVDKWRPVVLTERASAQSHFHDLCRLFGHPDPIQADPTGQWFTFEKGVPKSGGGDGFADVWKRQHFAWEYKKKKKNLDDALGQLARYALALESPPLHIACDTERFRIVTAWTNSIPRSYDLSLTDLLDPAKRDLLEAAFHRPERLKPGGSRADLTKTAADKFSSLARVLQNKGNSPEDVGHFLNRLAFLFFAEDIHILEDGYFRRILRHAATRPREAKVLFNDLFAVLKNGGRFGADQLPWINGGLFDDRPALELDDSSIALIVAAGSEDWAHVDPSIFGTLFERFLDPGKRSQIGAHYTDATQIMQIIEPVLIEPLRAEWRVARDVIERLTAKARIKGEKAKEWQQAREKRAAFIHRLGQITILDPACGSGNFLYLALQCVKDLEHTVNDECEVLGLHRLLPTVGPEILKGIEISPLAAELARTAIWIGDIQWSVRNGFKGRPEPILRRLDAIECRDALINEDGTKAEWPKAEFIIGNPPFLGVKKMIGGLGESYCKSLRKAYADTVSPFSDLVCWWFDKANRAVASGETTRVGLVATNSIRGGKNRLVLDDINMNLRIFHAWSDEDWVNDGAAVRVSLVCFANELPTGTAILDGREFIRLNSDLTPFDAMGGIDITQAKRLASNAATSFVGTVKAGAFDVDGSIARKWLRRPLNPNKKPNSDVVRPWINTIDLVRRPRDSWVVDFGDGMSEGDASLYEAPFEHVLENVRPARSLVRRPRYRDLWWQYAEPCMGMRRAISSLKRYIATPTLSKYRLFVFVDARVQPDHQLVAIARDDYTTLGILQSRFHEAWALRLGTSLEDRPRYTPTTTFETYPFPPGLGPDTGASTYAADDRARRIAQAAQTLDELRSNWLNPSDLVREETEVVAEYPSRLVPISAEAANELRTKTLTNLYNERPSWLVAAHRKLDEAVAEAYGWAPDIDIADALGRLLAMNLGADPISLRERASRGRGAALPVPLPLPGDGVRERGAGGDEVLDAVADAAVVLTPSHLASIGSKVGAADTVVDTHLGPTQAGEE